ncbi:MAG: 4-oxalomesaconate tautomerase [Porticoccaceae bacterium]|nr:4-oxalomesaconate tautomerase [Porticoccaceae bacterium]
MPTSFASLPLVPIMQRAIPYMQIRGGSSKGVYFCAKDLPSDPILRDRLLVRVMGADDRQIDGLGGADPLTSKVGIVSLSESEEADVDYLFAQIVVGEGRVDTTPNCGNILAGVAPFAIEAGLIEPCNGITKVRVNMLNSGSQCELMVQTPDKKVKYEGDACIDGVPGSSAPITCNYLNIAGAVCGSLLPTGNRIDIVDGIELTCIDNGMPVVVIRAKDMGITGDESPAELNANQCLKDKIQSIRLQIGPKMNLGDVDGAAVPKICMISPALNGGIFNTRTFIPYKCHSAIGVLGAVSAATAAIIPGTVAEGIAQLPTVTSSTLSVEHPSGEFSVSLEIDEQSDPPRVLKAGLLRTARLLSRGELYVPETTFSTI